MWTQIMALVPASSKRAAMSASTRAEAAGWRIMTDTVIMIQGDLVDCKARCMQQSLLHLGVPL